MTVGGDEPCIVLQHVAKNYTSEAGAVRVLCDIDLQVRRGAFEALLGPSGSGKSTLLHLIAGLELPSEGSVRVGGCEPARLTAAERAAWRANEVGFVFQNYRLFPMLTALENVVLPLQLTPAPKREHEARARTALKIVGLHDWADHRPEQLSGGQQQRVAIARAIVTDPTVLIADEPTGDLDRRTADHVLLLFTKLNQVFGKTIIMVTHDRLAAERASLVRSIDKGRLVSAVTNLGARSKRPPNPTLSKTYHGLGPSEGVAVREILSISSVVTRPRAKDVG